MGKTKKPAKVYLSPNQIGQLKYEADGFYNSFYLICDSLQAEQCVKMWGQSGNILSVLGTIGAFAIELYLKLLHAIATFDEGDKKGLHYTAHNLKSLYGFVTKANAEFIKQLEEVYKNSFYKKDYNESVLSFCKSIQALFNEWRYSHEKTKPLNVNLNELSDVLKMLKCFTNEKFIHISELIDRNQKLPQSITIVDWNSLKRIELSHLNDGELDDDFTIS